MYKIIALFGKSASGKDYLFTHLKADFLNYVIPWTSRPQRQGEIEGKNYYFKKDSDFNKTEFLVLTSFKGWFYGFPEDAFSESCWNIGIFNIFMINALKEDDRCKVIPFYIKAPDGDRLERQLNREKEPDLEEIIRRYKADKEDYEEIPFSYFEIHNDIKYEKEKNNGLYSLRRNVELITDYS